MSSHEIGTKCDGATVTVDRRIDLTRILQGVALVIQNLRVFWFKRQRALETSQCAVQLPVRCQGHPKSFVGLNRLGIQSQSLLINGYGFAGPTS